MSLIAKTPQPPYYAVIAPAVLTADVQGYPQMAMRLVELAQTQEGFLGIESCIHGSFALAVSYWHSLEAIEAWRNNARHMAAKDLGRTRWFAEYTTRIARVETVR